METYVVNDEIIRLILAQLDKEEGEGEYYGRLLERLIDGEDFELLETVVLIKKKHELMLKELYYRLKGERLKEEERPQAAETGGSLAAEFRKGAVSELKNSEIYRSLKYDFLNQSIRDSFDEMMTDSQNNGVRFSLLVTKYS